MTNAWQNPKKNVKQSQQVSSIFGVFRCNYLPGTVDATRMPATALKDTPETVLKNLKLLTEDGKKFNLKKTYKVVTNDFVAAICDSPRKDEGRNTGLKTADVIIKFLEKKGKVDYHGVQRVFFNQ